MNKKGFTLLELLVVVLIIGILAGIALPQYKLAVAKSQYATLKNATKSLKESVDRYFLATGTYPTKSSDLDIGFNITEEWDNNGISFYIRFPGVENCEIYYDSSRLLWCKKTIAGKLMTYSDFSYPGTIRSCLVYSPDSSDIPNKVCQGETGKTASQATCGERSCSYRY